VVTERLSIYLKSGAIIEHEVDDWSLDKRASNDITAMTWAMADGNDTRMPYLRLDDISAVVVTPIEQEHQ
jgi:hypothetical protein